MYISQYLAPLAVLLGLGQAMPPPRHHVERATAFDPSNATLDEFAAHALEVAKTRIANSTGTCTPENVIVRKEIESLSGDEMIAYTSALNCLMQLAAKTPSELAPGAKTRYDDWVTAHINQTLVIHGTVRTNDGIPTQKKKIANSSSDRQIFSAGTVYSPGRWSRACATSAIIPAPSPTGTGPRPPSKVSMLPRRSMGQQPACQAMGCR